MKIKMKSEKKIVFVAKTILDQSKLMEDERNFSLKIYKFACVEVGYDDVVNILNKFAKEGLFEIVITKGMYGDVDNTSVIYLSNIKLEDIKNRSMNIKKSDSEDTVVLKKLINDFESFNNINGQPISKNIDTLIKPLRQATENIKNSIEPSIKLTKKNLQPLSNMMNELKKSSFQEEVSLKMSVAKRNPELEVLNEISTKLDKNIIKSAEIDSNGEKVVYEIKYCEQDREIFLNGVLLAKPYFGSPNERFFTYVYARPNTKISVYDIEKEYGDLCKNVHKIISDLNFKGDIKKVFFSASKEMVEFRNPISQNLLDNLKIKYLSIKPLQK